MIGIIMGSTSDASVMEEAARTCEEFAFPYEMTVVSAHRTPDRLVRYAREAEGRGIQVIIAGAGGAAHLPGMVAAMTPLPVIGVPVRTRALSGLDSLLSIVQMPRGIPVATVAIDGARNAALLALRIIGSGNENLRRRMSAFLETQRLGVEETLHQVERKYNPQDPADTGGAL
jgi:phosphoribosylaminoimidazole carboxylase PurE protein